MSCKILYEWNRVLRMIDVAFTSCSARGMALIGTAMANGGVAANGARLFSEVSDCRLCKLISMTSS